MRVRERWWRASDNCSIVLFRSHNAESSAMPLLESYIQAGRLRPVRLMIKFDSGWVCRGTERPLQSSDASGSRELLASHGRLLSSAA